MNQAKLITALPFLLLVSIPYGWGQEKCGMNLYKKHLLKNYSQQAVAQAPFDGLSQSIVNDSQLIVIPVVVHVIHNNLQGNIGGENNSNISTTQVISQIEVLNEDFRKKAGSAGENFDTRGADLRIEFQLADKDPQGTQHSGINRVYQSRNEWNLNDEEFFKKLFYWPSDTYLNIWVLNLNGSNLGYGQFPSGTSLPDLNYPDPGKEYDGIVIDYTAFGRIGATAKNYNQGRTATHEIGHWLGLQHIWGDEYCGNDFVNDTPEHESQNLSCKVKYSFCKQDSTKDMISNYMDYTPDYCMNIFTEGQKDRIRTVLNTSPRRRKLVEQQLRDTTVLTSVYNSSEYKPLLIVQADAMVIKIQRPALFSRLLINDVIGKTIYEKTIMATNSLELQLSTFSSGMYIFSYFSQQRNYVSRFCIP